MTSGVAFVILVAATAVCTGAAAVKSKLHDSSYSEEFLAALPGGAELVEAVGASHAVADQLKSVTNVESEVDGHSLSRSMLVALPGGEALDLLAGADALHSFLTVRTKRGDSTFTNSLITHLASGAALLGAFTGAIVGAVAGNSAISGGPGSIPCGVAGGLAGGVVGWLWDWQYHIPKVDKTDDAGAGLEEEAQNKSVELPEPALEKLHQLALSAVALSDYEEGLAKLDGNETERLLERADEKKATKALDDIVERIDSSEREPMNQSNGDFEDIQDVLSEGETSEFVTAEAALANNALVTANDLARVGGKNGSRIRGEDVGPAGDLKSFQGDMVAGSSKQLELFQTMANGSPGKKSRAAGTLWKDAKVNFCFASDVSEHVKHIFLAATNQFATAIPCLEFVDVGWKSGSSTSPEPRQKCKVEPAIFVQSNPREGCYSYVGMAELPSQRLQLQEPGCLSIGTAIHELGHALGMAHEQSRPDRGKYVRIHWENVQSGMENNFDIVDNAYAEEDYDILSIMHYDRFAFTRDRNKETIEWVGPGVHDELGQRAGLSSFDVSQMVAMYKDADGDCKGNALAGMGCINKPSDSGKDVCNITKCNSMAASHCCACDGGVKVQCYDGQDCPKSDPLPDLDASECIEDATHLFAGKGYACIYSNVCKFNVEFKCPGFDCSHKVRPKNYEAAMCQNQFQTDICTAKEKCKISKM